MEEDDTFTGSISISGNTVAGYGFIPASTNISDGWVTIDRHSQSIGKLREDIAAIKDRLAILTPALELHEHYPALKAAYDNYRVIERMVRGDD